MFLEACDPRPKGRTELFVIERRAHLGPSASESVHSTGARVKLPRIEGTAAPASDKIFNQPTASTGQGGNLARRRYQKGSVIFSKSRQAWLGRYREDAIRPDGTVIRTRPQVVLGTKKELPTQRLAARKLDEILSRINDYAYQPTRISTIAEFAKR